MGMTSSKHFLAYWKPDTADANLARRRLLNHSAGEQFGRVSRGDTVWIVTVRKGRLVLLGRIVVDRVTDQATAERILDDRDLWEATHHLIAQRGTEVELTETPIDDPAALRFESSSGRDRLTVVRGRVDAKQLQTMRICTDECAEMLRALVSAPVAPKRAARQDRERRPVQRTAAKSSRQPSNVLETLECLQQAVHPDLLHRNYRDTDRSQNPLNGFCYALAEAMHHLFPGRFQPHMIKWGPGDTHWFLRGADGQNHRSEPRGRKAGRELYQVARV